MARKSENVLSGQHQGESGKVHLYIEEIKPGQSPTVDVDGRAIQVFRPLAFWRSVHGIGDGLLIPNTHGPGAFTVGPESLTRWTGETLLQIKLRFVKD